jgi:hypothetical protein
MAVGRSADAHDPQAITTQLKPWLHYAVAMLTVAAAILINPFGWSNETANVSHDITQRFAIGPLLYPAEKAPVTVVLLDDLDLQARNAAWPLKMNDQADILLDILDGNPRAVFVDFIFVDQREGDDATKLNAVIREYKANGVPLFFARAEDPAIGKPIRDDIAQAEPDFTSVVLPDEHDMARAYSPCSRPAHDPESCLCVTRNGSVTSCAAAKPTDRRVLTAAFSMYAERLKGDLRDIDEARKTDPAFANRGLADALERAQRSAD